MKHRIADYTKGRQPGLYNAKVTLDVLDRCANVRTLITFFSEGTEPRYNVERGLELHYSRKFIVANEPVKPKIYVAEESDNLSRQYYAEIVAVH